MPTDYPNFVAPSLVPDPEGTPFAAAVAHTRMAMILTDPRQPDNPIVYANDAFRRLTGYPPEEIIGRNCRFLQGADTDPQVVEEIRSAVREEREVHVELVNHRRDGTPFWNALLITPVRDAAGRLRYFFGSQWDVGDRKRLEQELIEQSVAFRAEMAEDHRLTPVGLLAGTLAHELTQPLTAVINYAQVVEQTLADQADGAARSVVLDLLRQAQRANGIVERMRHLIRRGEPVKTETDLGLLARKAAALVPRRPEGTTVAFDLPRAPVVVAIDTVQIEQVVYNLVRNACEATPRGCVRVAVEPATDRVEVCVRDDGPGLPPERLPDPFEPGVSGGGGLGLGLALCRAIVEAHGGEIWGRNRDEGGAEFGFRLPRGER